MGGFVKTVRALTGAESDISFAGNFFAAMGANSEGCGMIVHSNSLLSTLLTPPNDSSRCGGNSIGSLVHHSTGVL